MAQLLKNPYYYLYLFVTATAVVALYFILEKRKTVTQKVVLFSLTVIAAAFYFLRLVFIDATADEIKIGCFPLTITAALTLLYPLFFFTKNETIKDAAYYIGLFVGAVDVIYPQKLIDGCGAWILTSSMVCGAVIFAVSLLTVLLKLHELSYRRIWKVPFVYAALTLFVFANMSLVNVIFNVPYAAVNESMIAFPQGGLSVLVTYLVPSFLKTEVDGVITYTPYFYMLPAVILYGVLLPVVMCLPWQLKPFLNDLRRRKDNSYKGAKKRKSNSGVKIKSQDVR